MNTMAALGSLESKLYRVQQTTYFDGHEKEVDWMTLLM
jgi:hypothetical protein